MDTGSHRSTAIKVTYLHEGRRQRLVTGKVQALSAHTKTHYMQKPALSTMSLIRVPESIKGIDIVV